MSGMLNTVPIILNNTRDVSAIQMYNSLNEVQNKIAQYEEEHEEEYKEEYKEEQSTMLRSKLVGSDVDYFINLSQLNITTEEAERLELEDIDIEGSTASQQRENSILRGYIRHKQKIINDNEYIATKPEVIPFLLEDIDLFKHLYRGNIRSANIEFLIKQNDTLDRIFNKDSDLNPYIKNYLVQFSLTQSIIDIQEKYIAHLVEKDNKGLLKAVLKKENFANSFFNLESVMALNTKIELIRSVAMMTDEEAEEVEEENNREYGEETSEETSEEINEEITIGIKDFYINRLFIEENRSFLKSVLNQDNFIQSLFDPNNEMGWDNKFHAINIALSQSEVEVQQKYITTLLDVENKELLETVLEKQEIVDSVFNPYSGMYFWTKSSIITAVLNINNLENQQQYINGLFIKENNDLLRSVLKEDNFIQLLFDLNNEMSWDNKFHAINIALNQSGTEVQRQYITKLLDISNKELLEAVLGKQEIVDSVFNQYSGTHFETKISILNCVLMKIDKPEIREKYLAGLILPKNEFILNKIISSSEFMKFVFDLDNEATFEVKKSLMNFALTKAEPKIQNNYLCELLQCKINDNFQTTKNQIFSNLLFRQDEFMNLLFDLNNRMDFEQTREYFIRFILLRGEVEIQKKYSAEFFLEKNKELANQILSREDFYSAMSVIDEKIDSTNRAFIFQSIINIGDFELQKKYVDLIVDNTFSSFSESILLQDNFINEMFNMTNEINSKNKQYLISLAISTDKSTIQQKYQSKLLEKDNKEFLYEVVKDYDFIQFTLSRNSGLSKFYTNITQDFTVRDNVSEVLKINLLKNQILTTKKITKEMKNENFLLLYFDKQIREECNDLFTSNLRLFLENDESFVSNSVYNSNYNGSIENHILKKIVVLNHYNSINYIKTQMMHNKETIEDIFKMKLNFISAYNEEPFVKYFIENNSAFIASIIKKEPSQLFRNYKKSFYSNFINTHPDFLNDLLEDIKIRFEYQDHFLVQQYFETKPEKKTEILNNLKLLIHYFNQEPFITAIKENQDLIGEVFSNNLNELTEYLNYDFVCDYFHANPDFLIANFKDKLEVFFKASVKESSIDRSIVKDSFKKNYLDIANPILINLLHNNLESVINNSMYPLSYYYTKKYPENIKNYLVQNPKLILNIESLIKTNISDYVDFVKNIFDSNPNLVQSNSHNILVIQYVENKQKEMKKIEEDKQKDIENVEE